MHTDSENDFGQPILTSMPATSFALWKGDGVPIHLGTRLVKADKVTPSHETDESWSKSLWHKGKNDRQAVHTLAARL